MGRVPVTRYPPHSFRVNLTTRYRRMSAKKNVVKYRFQPPVREIAEVQKRMETVKLQRDVTNLVLRGKSWEQIAEKLGVTPEEAYAISRSVISKWTKEMATTAPEQKEIDLRRLSAMLDAIHDKVFPQPFIDAKTGAVVQPDPDPVFTKIYLDIIDRRRAMLGTDAARKMEIEGEINVIRREYVGANPDDL